MSAPTTVRATSKKIAFNIEVGDVIVASLTDGGPFQTALYTVTHVWPHDGGDETMTIELAYAYRTGGGTRTVGIRRMDFVTVV